MITKIEKLNLTFYERKKPINGTDRSRGKSPGFRIDMGGRSSFLENYI